MLVVPSPVGEPGNKAAFWGSICLWVGEGMHSEVHSDPPYRVALIMLTTLAIVVLATTLRQLTHWARWPTNGY